MAVSESTILSDIFSEIFTILNSNAYSITNNNNDTITLNKSGSNYWFGAFPDIDIEDSSNYPIGIIRSPEFEENMEGFRFKQIPSYVDIAVFDTRAEHPPKFVEKAMYQLRQNASSLREAGLHSLEAGRSNTDMDMRGDMKIHSVTVPVELTYSFEVSS